MALFTTFTAIVLYLFPSVGAAGCPRDWVRFQDYCLALDREKSDWLTAEATCRVFNAHLVSLQTEEKYLNLRAFLKMKNDTEDIWIDGTDNLAMGDWMWANTGQILTYTKWAPAEPNYLLTSFCVAAGGGGVDWWSRDCKNQYAFVCEKKITEPDGTLIG